MRLTPSTRLRLACHALFGASLLACAAPQRPAAPATPAPASPLASPARPSDGTLTATPSAPEMTAERLAAALGPRTLALPPLPSPPADGAARAKWLGAQLDALFGGPGQVPAPLGAAKVSVSVLDQETGRVLYAREPKAQLNAASNVKLVTSSAALSLLGPEYRFRTAVYGPQRTSGRYLEAGGELAGDLYFRGGGDPTFETADLSELANQLWALGIRRIKGNLVVDPTFFDSRVLPPAYEQKDESGAYRAPSSATSLNANAVAITVLPAPKPGQAARVLLEPASDHFEVTGRILSSSRAPAWPVIETLAGTDGKTRIQIGGRITTDQTPRTFSRRVVDPALYLGHTALVMLARRGITLQGKVEVGPTPEGLRLLATHVSEPLAVVVHEMNKRSNNFVAEQLVRTLGAEALQAPGSWDKGLEAVARYLEALGIKRGTYRMENAAGLYDSNRFSSEQIAVVLRAALRDFRISGEFAASLPLAGIDGTLAQRMAGSPAERYVRGKTGTLLGTSALSGLVGSPNRAPLVFSILMNEVTDTALARAVQDQAATVLAWYLNPASAPVPVAEASRAAPYPDP
ncbi:MAG: D-alanyl-D-alanine carboxypeptidase/D-alanyl-D-alanine-endopeptidase [Myxococcales bacterium]|nr:D-alanyl-D-alanine carboxypeptidase/D-alanyl-D-alanine-endopeptidase [Myxococcales bacterium]